MLADNVQEEDYTLIQSCSVFRVPTRYIASGLGYKSGVIHRLSQIDILQLLVILKHTYTILFLNICITGKNKYFYL